MEIFTPCSRKDGYALFSHRFRIIGDDVWHRRLGQPHMQVMDHLKKNKLISPVDKNKREDLCCSCQMAKACRLPSPVLSFQRFQYYVIFIDECTRFTWFYPLKQKSDFTRCFINFHNSVNTQFEKKIFVCFKVMAEVNLLDISFKIIYLIMALFTKCLAHIHPNRMAWQRGNIEMYSLYAISI